MSEIKVVGRSEFQKIIQRETVLADFYAPWCGPCQMMGEILKSAIADFPKDAVTVKVNIDAEPALAAEYGVMTVPHLILFRDGKKVTESVGVQSRSALLGLFDLVTP